MESKKSARRATGAAAAGGTAAARQDRDTRTAGGRGRDGAEHVSLQPK
ncbi:MAG: hypothetical protein IKO01_04105 [Kiritimatiellae bacterium]|nr:hypothetical protein [Kiritimatiellia bacterium]MBR4252954.1 hypothetical protein [Kiritimatiellia bacterium]